LLPAADGYYDESESCLPWLGSCLCDSWSSIVYNRIRIAY
jgi:hypothetical protein